MTSKTQDKLQVLKMQTIKIMQEDLENVKVYKYKTLARAEKIQNKLFSESHTILKDFYKRELLKLCNRVNDLNKTIKQLENEIQEELQEV